MPYAIPLIYLAAAGIGTAGTVYAAKKNADGTDSTDTTGVSSPEMQEMIKLMTNRTKKQEPLFDALTQLGTNLLPRSAQAKYPGRAYSSVDPNGVVVEDQWTNSTKQSPSSKYPDLPGPGPYNTEQGEQNTQQRTFSGFGSVRPNTVYRQ